MDTFLCSSCYGSLASSLSSGFATYADLYLPLLKTQLEVFLRLHAALSSKFSLTSNLTKILSLITIMIRPHFSPQFFSLRDPHFDQTQHYFIREGEIICHYAVTNLSLTGHLKCKGIFEGGNFRNANYSHSHRVFNKKKGWLKIVTALSHKRKKQCLIWQFLKTAQRVSRINLRTNLSMVWEYFQHSITHKRLI